MANVMTNKIGKKSVKNPVSSLERKSSKQKRISQGRKHSEKKIASSEKQQRVKKIITDSAIKKLAKGTTNKGAKSIKVAQKKSLQKDLYKGVSKEEDTLKIGKASKNEMEKVERFIEEISRRPKPIDQKKIPIVEIKNFLKKCVNSCRKIFYRKF